MTLVLRTGMISSSDLGGHAYMEPISALESFIDKYERASAWRFTQQDAKVESYDERQWTLPFDVIQEGFEACLEYLTDLGAIDDESGSSDDWLEIFIEKP